MRTIVAQDRKLKRMVIHAAAQSCSTLTPKSRTHEEESGRSVLIVLYLA